MKTEVLLEEKKLGKFSQHIKFARGEIDEMLELIREITHADIEPARLVHATNELCEGVESSLVDLDVASIQVGELQVKVKPLELDTESSRVTAVSCDVVHVKDTCNLRDANISLAFIAKGTLQAKSESSVVGGPLLGIAVHVRAVVAVQRSALVFYSLDGGLKRRINHPFLEAARAVVRLHSDHLAIVCGGKSWSDAKIIVFTADGQYKGILADGDFCDVAVAGKKMYALSHTKPKIFIFATNSHNKWVVTGSIALDAPTRHVRDSITTTSVSVLVAFHKTGRIQEFTLTGEPMNDLAFPGSDPATSDVSDNAQVKLGSSDYAGAVLCSDAHGKLKVLDAHRKWLDTTLPVDVRVINSLAVDDKGGIWMNADDKLVYLQATNG